MDAIALVSLWMTRSRHARAVALIIGALVDAGGLSLACQVKNGMVVLGEALAGSVCHELVRCIPHQALTGGLHDAWLSARGNMTW